MFTLFKKEILGFFHSFTAYISAISFTVICSLFLWYFNNDFNIFISENASLSSFFFIGPWIFLILLPAITMHSIAGEESKGTLSWLFTQPIKIWQILLAKYFSTLLVLLFCLLFTTLYIYTLDQLTLESDKPDFAVIYCGYFGLFLIGCTFLSIGIFCSSMTSNPVLAYMASIFLCFIFWYGFESLAFYNLLGTYDYYVQKIGFQIHYNQFLKGILDTKALAYLVFCNVVFLWLSHGLIKKKK